MHKLKVRGNQFIGRHAEFMLRSAFIIAFSLTHKAIML